MDQMQPSAIDSEGKEVIAGDWDRLDWLRMSGQATDPDIKSQNMRKRQREERMAEKMRDTGL